MAREEAFAEGDLGKRRCLPLCLDEYVTEDTRAGSRPSSRRGTWPNGFAGVAPEATGGRVPSATLLTYISRS